MLRDDAAAKMEEMAAALEELKKKERVTESVVQEARKRNAEIKVKPIPPLAHPLCNSIFAGETKKQRKLQTNITFRREAYRFDQGK